MMSTSCARPGTLAHRALLIILLVTALAGLDACAGGTPGNAASLTIGIDGTAVNSLLFVALDQKQFGNNALDVTLKPYPSGLAATNGMLAGEVDLAVAAEFVVVGKAFAGQPVRAFGSIDKFMHNYLLARRDRGIAAVADLKGKRIGLPRKTAAEFYLGRFLELNAMDIGQVTLVDLDPTKLVGAITTGGVDAVVAWEPNAKTISDTMGDSIVKWPAQNNQVAYAVLLHTDKWAAQNRDRTNRLLRALAQAEDFTASHPDQARAIVQKRLNADDSLMATIWPEHRFSLSLEQSLVVAMEDEARWLIRSNLTPDSQIPDFASYVDTQGLSAVKPGAVNVIK